MKIFKKLIAIFIVSYSLNVTAEPSPLGIKINKDTIAEIEKIYQIIQTEPNATPGYYNNSLNTKGIDMEGHTRVTVISNNNKVVEGVILTLEKHRFEDVYSALSNKSKIVRSELPFVGDKVVELQDEGCHIIVNCPHLSGTMQVMYVSQKLDDKYKERKVEERKMRKNKTNDML